MAAWVNLVWVLQIITALLKINNAYTLKFWFLVHSLAFFFVWRIAFYNRMPEFVCSAWWLLCYKIKKYYLDRELCLNQQRRRKEWLLDLLLWKVQNKLRLSWRYSRWFTWKLLKNLQNFILIFSGLQELNGKTIGNNRTLKVSDVIERPFEKINKAALLEKPSPTNNDDEEGSVLPDAASKSRSARDAVTPLAHMSYSDQLEHKKNNLAQILKRLVSISYLLVMF